MRMAFGSRNIAAALAALWCATAYAGTTGTAMGADTTQIPSPSTGDEDPLDLAWSTTFSVPGLTGAVNCMTSFENRLVAAGRFDYAGSVAALGVATWDADGWHAVGNADFGAGVDVRGLAVFRNQLVAVGSARGTAGVRGPFVQVWNGNAWTPLQTPGDVTSDAGILCAAVYHDDLIVAGRFTTVGGVVCNNIARWDGARWHALGSGTAGNSGAVNSLTVFRDELIAAGDFVRAGGQFASGVARWNGSGWHGVGYGIVGLVECVAVYHDELIAGGWFDYAEGKLTRRIARWNGVEWRPLGAGIDGVTNASPVYALGEMNGVLVVGGIFDRAGGIGSSNLAFWNGNTWSAPPRGIEPGAGFSYVRAFHNYAGQTYVGGWFRLAGGERAVNIARLDPDGSFHGLGGGQGINGSVATLTAGADGSVIAAGWFDWAGSTRARAVARWDGSRWSAYGVGLDRPVAALLPTASGLVAGGDFLTSGTTVVSHVAIWKNSSWDPMGAGFDASVQALVHYKGEIVAGGDFGASGDTKLPGIARWDGVAWQPVGPEFPGATGVFVRAVAVHGEDLYAAGWLYKEDGPSREFVAHWDGVTWSVVDAPRATAVLKIVFAGDDLIVGVAASQSPEPMDLVWTWDGMQWNPVGNLLDGWVTALTVRDGTLYAGTSNFEQEDGNVWAWTGSEWTPLASRFQGGVRALFPVADGMYAGGAFDRVGTRPAGSIAFWSARAVPVAIEDLRATALAAGIRVEWSCKPSTAGGATLRVERARAESGPFEAGSNWLSPTGPMTFEDVHVQLGEWYWYRVVMRDGSGLQTASAAIAVQYAPIPAAGVWLAAPRPANGGRSIELRYSTGSRPGPVALTVYDVRGRAVRALVRERATPGVHVVVWDRTGSRGKPVGRGIYFARLEAAGAVRTVRLPLLAR